jgi:hypothetical protein
MVEYVKLGDPWVGPVSCGVYLGKYISTLDLCIMLGIRQKGARAALGPFLMDSETTLSIKKHAPKAKRLFMKIADIPALLKRLPNANSRVPEFAERAMQYFNKYIVPQGNEPDPIPSQEVEEPSAPIRKRSREESGISSSDDMPEAVPLESLAEMKAFCDKVYKTGQASARAELKAELRVELKAELREELATELRTIMDMFARSRK